VAESELTLTTRLTTQVASLLTALDIDLVGKETAKTINQIKRLAADVRLDVRDWEMSDTRAELEKNAQAVRKRFEELRRHILKASEHGIFGPVDVVDISSQIDAILARLE
jgi:hypothetical protein